MFNVAGSLTNLAIKLAKHLSQALKWRWEKWNMITNSLTIAEKRR